MSFLLRFVYKELLHIVPEQCALILLNNRFILNETMIIMPKEIKTDDMMQFSQIISIKDGNEHVIKSNLLEHSSKSIMIDVLLMLLCEQSDHNPTLEDTDLSSD